MLGSKICYLLHYPGAPSLAQYEVDAGTAGLPLALAYAYCAKLTAQHSRSFYLGFSFATIKRSAEACRALYAFCRISDDIVDSPGRDPQAALITVARPGSRRSSASTHHPVVMAFNDTCQRFAIPRCYAHQLIDGVGLDLAQTRYQTFDELTHYCYGVASTVGLMSMHIIGYCGEEAIPYAIKLGVALQMTNILRDVGEDLAAGRLYLPQAELHEFQLTVTALAQGVVTARWQEFMAFQIARVRHLYQEAWPGIAMLAPNGRMAIAAAATFYRGILDDIEAHNYDVFRRRAFVSKWHKVRQLPAIWWRCQ